MKKKPPKGIECYRAHARVKSFLNDLLTWRNNKARLELDINARGATQEDLIERREKLNQEKKNLNSRKVDFLNEFIFPSMANLTVFLETLTDSPGISDIFEDDLRALFLAESAVEPPMRPKKVRSIFGRFIAASCIPTKRTKGTIPADLRLILCDIIQYSVLEAMKELGQYKFIEKFSDSEFATKTLIFDIDRAHAWTTMLSSEAWNGLHIDKETRPALF